MNSMAQGAAIERTEVNANIEGSMVIEAVWGTGIVDSDTQQSANNLIDFPTKEIS